MLHKVWDLEKRSAATWISENEHDLYAKYVVLLGWPNRKYEANGECGMHRSDGTYIKFLVGNPEWKTQLQRLGYICGIILKYILNM